MKTPRIAERTVPRIPVGVATLRPMSPAVQDPDDGGAADEVMVCCPPCKMLESSAAPPQSLSRRVSATDWKLFEALVVIFVVWMVGAAVVVVLVPALRMGRQPKTCHAGRVV